MKKNKKKQNNILNFPFEMEEEISEDLETLPKINNNIYFYSDVMPETILNFNKCIQLLNIQLLNMKNIYSINAPNIKIHINSNGGSLIDGLNAMDYILNSKVPTCSYIEGCAASAATFLSIVCKERYIQKHSLMLIHQLSSWAYGNYEQLKDDMINNELLMNMIKNIYRNYSKLPTRILRDLLKRDLYLDSMTCKKYGLIDEII